MRVRLHYAGEGVGIPKTPLTMGVGLISVWIDGVGFTSASNDTGAVGYVLLDTNIVDIDTVDGAIAEKFASLHGRNIRFDLAPNTFLYDGGTARIRMTVLENEAGEIAEYPVEFVVNNCTGIAFKSDAFSFTAEMFQMERALAENEILIDDQQLTAAVEAANAQSEGIA